MKTRDHITRRIRNAPETDRQRHMSSPGTRNGVRTVGVAQEDPKKRRPRRSLALTAGELIDGSAAEPPKG